MEVKRFHGISSCVLFILVDKTASKKCSCCIYSDYSQDTKTFFLHVLCQPGLSSFFLHLCNCFFFLSPPKKILFSSSKPFSFLSPFIEYIYECELWADSWMKWLPLGSEKRILLERLLCPSIQVLEKEWRRKNIKKMPSMESADRKGFKLVFPTSNFIEQDLAHLLFLFS